MKRSLATLGAVVLTVMLVAAPARADFGFKGDPEFAFVGPDGARVHQAGSHPYAAVTEFEVETVTDPEKGEIPDGSFRDLNVTLPPGFAGTPDPTPHCSTSDFLNVANGYSACPNSTAIGIAFTNGGFQGPGVIYSSVYNLSPAPGVAAKIGFIALEVPVIIEVGVRPDPPYNLIARVKNITQAGLFYSSKLTLWGVPGSSAHDSLRGTCLDVLSKAPDPVSLGNCPVDTPEKPFLTLPRSCTGPLVTGFTALAWNTGATDSATAISNDGADPASPLGMTGCSKLDFDPRLNAQPTTDLADSPTGFSFNLNVDDQGITSADGTADSDIEKAAVTLPEGVTLNPSIAEGLVACTPAAYANERVDSEPGQGCPEASKVGEIEVETPILEGRILRGSLFVAQPDDSSTSAPGAENPFDSLIAFYIVIKDRTLGVMVKQAGKVEPDPATGQLVSVLDNLPQFPLGQVRLRFREGARSPLISPGRCGTFTTEAIFTPWANPSRPVASTSSFQIVKGPGAGPCPAPGSPPFSPGFEAGSINNDAGSYTPFYMRLTRRDGDQDMVRFSSILPPGLLGKLAGVAKCPQASIDNAESRSGRAEQAVPSCPTGSQIGRVVAGAGVGSQLTYVPGKAYLAGPYKGAPLSVAVITPAVAGPFDAGTVAVQVGLDVNPVTGEVVADGAASDPIPHILQGIPLRVKDLRVYVDRPNFILNPTSCKSSQVKATLWGGGADPFSTVDDAPVPLAARFQAANCSDLGFKPRLSFRLVGGTRRGGHPALRAVLRPRPGDANLSKVTVRLPRSAFLDQGHIRTVCTRVQFAAGRCPPGSIYGHVRAFTPLLDEPLEGPAYLRSSDNLLPDLVFSLKGVVDIEAAARIDSIKGGIRATFQGIPDAPVSKVVVDMEGGKQGLIVNSRNLCSSGKSRANVRLQAQNGKQRRLSPLVRPDCGKANKRAKP